MTQKQIKILQKEILDWFAKNKRDLPWRRVPYDTRFQRPNPYHILVSEVMLQQTQVNRVIPKYNAWLEKFPDIQSLANASNRDVLTLWSGLGYNRRALYLKELAVRIVKDFGGVLPRSEKELMTLPGIGKYTARAILCFAFNEQIAVVDTNVKRVILTNFIARGPAAPYPSPTASHPLQALDRGPQSRHPSLSNSEIQKIADQLLPKGRAYEWNQALMDYSALVLSKDKNPSISLRAKKIPFKDSDRYYRGAIIRLLLQHSRLSQKQIYIHLEGKIDSIRLKKILNQLKKEAILKEDTTYYAIVDS